MLSLVFSLLCLLLATIPTSTQAQTACNGHPALCDRQYSNVTQIGTHDSAFVGALPQDNQDQTITAQLDAGIRFLQAQTHVNPFGTLSLCHTSCYLLDAGSVASYLVTVKAWLDANPNEVLTLLLTNGDNVNADMFDTAFTTSGIKPYAFIPASSPLPLTAWPTLQDLITANTRLIFFLGNPTPPPPPPPSPYQTPYSTPPSPPSRLRRLPPHPPLHPRRIRLLLRNPLRHPRPDLLAMHARPARERQPGRPHVHHQPLPGRVCVRHRRPGQRGGRDDERGDGDGQRGGAGGVVRGDVWAEAEGGVGGFLGEGGGVEGAGCVEWSVSCGRWSVDVGGARLNMVWYGDMYMGHLKIASPKDTFHLRALNCDPATTMPAT